MIGYVIKERDRKCYLSRPFSKRSLAKRVLSKYQERNPKARIVRVIYKEPKTMSDEDKKWAKEFSQGMNQALREVMR